MINDRDWQYRFWRRASKNPSRSSASSSSRRRSRATSSTASSSKLAGSNFKHKSRLPVELMEAYGRKRARDGFTHVVFGHFHNKLVMPAGRR